MRFSLLAAAVLSVTGIFACASAQAAVLSVPSGAGGAYDRTLTGPGTRGTESATVFQIGESAIDANNYRAYVPFALTAQDQADLLVPAATATLFVNLAIAQGAAGSTLSLVGLTGRSQPGGGGVIGLTTDYENPAAQVIQSGIPVAVQGYNLDVTAYVKAQAASNTAIAFRLQGDNVAKADGLQNLLTFNSADHANVGLRPKLTIAVVPEPASLVAVAGAGACLLRRRRPISA